MTLDCRRAKVLWLIGVTVLSATLIGIPLSQQRESPAKNGTTQIVPVALLNNWDLDYIWIDRNVSARVWVSGFDASDEPIATASGVLELPDNHLGNGFQVTESKIAHGYITLPSNFDVRGYIRSGYELHLGVRVVPRGYYNASFPFRIDPDIWFGNANGQLFLNGRDQPETVYITFKP